MKLREFTESVVTLLENGVYYYKDEKYKTPSRIKQISERAMENFTETIMVEFSDPEDTFMVTIHRNDYDKPGTGSSDKDKA